jgi:ribosomal protein S24E
MMSEVKFHVHKKEDVPLLSRERIVLLADYEGAVPARIKVREQACGFLKIPLDVCIVKHIYTKFGSQKAKVIVHVYKSADEAKKYEEAHIFDKQAGKVKKAAAGAA